MSNTFIRKWGLRLSLVGVPIGVGLVWNWQRKCVSQSELLRKFDGDERIKAMDWVPPTRQSLINNLKASAHKVADGGTGPYDLLIIGGGATGTGCALDAASRGLRVACVERGDFSAETSSKSTKLVHGGVRYLEKALLNFDWEQFQLVREALRERSTFLQVAPHLAEPLPIMLPVYKWYLVPYYWVGSKMYDVLSGRWGLEDSYYLTKTRALEVFPMLRKDRLKGAMVYYDGQSNDARVNLALALTALQQGATVVNYVEVIGFIKKNRGGVDDPPQIVGARLLDRATGEEFEVRAKGCVNATGPFCDLIRRLDDPSVPLLVTASSGTHIVFPNYYSPRNMGLVDPSSSDGRVIFFLPWQGNTIAGTTDAPTTVHFEPKAKNSEIDFILREVTNYLDPVLTVRRSDVLAAWAGIRPLIRDPGIRKNNNEAKEPSPAVQLVQTVLTGAAGPGAAKAISDVATSSAPTTESLVRSHLVMTSPSGLLTIAGGKWTTYRQMAEDTIDEAIKAFGLNPIHSKVSKTREIPLIGAHGFTFTGYIRLIQQFGLETEVAQHLNRNYGDRAHLIAEMAEQTGTRWPVHGKRLSPLYPFIEAEVRYAVRSEYAIHATDVIARRLRIAFLSCQAANDVLPRILEIMKEELKWSKEECERQKLEAERFLVTMGIRDLYPIRAHFNHVETQNLRNQYNDMDKSKRGRVQLSELLPMLRQMVPDEPGLEPVPWLELLRSHVINSTEAVELDENGMSKTQVSSDDATETLMRASLEFTQFLEMLSLGRGHLEQAKAYAKIHAKLTKYTMTKDPHRSGGGV